MFHLLDPRKILALYALTTVAISVAVYSLLQYALNLDWSPFKIIGLSSTVSSVLSFLLFATPLAGVFWALARRISKNVYPNLTGCWRGTIQPTNVPEGFSTSPLKMVARIRHSPLNLYIDFDGETFESATLSAVPAIEQGRHQLYYIYRSDSKVPGRSNFIGTAKLRVAPDSSSEGGSLAMRGHYFTGRGAIGMIELSQVGRDPDGHVATA